MPATMTETDAALWAEYRETRSEHARNALIERHMPFVRFAAMSLARKLPDCVSYEDLLADAVFGLIDAMNGYDPARGCTFTTFASRRVNGAMLDAIRKADWVPRLVRHREKELESQRSRLRQELGRDPTDSDLGRRGPVQIGSLDAPTMTCDRGVRSRADIVASREPCPDDAHAKRDFWARACRGLSKVERVVVLLRYRENERMRAIGQHVGLCESRISQMLSDLRPRLQRNLADA